MRKCNFYLVLTFLIGMMSVSCNENDGVALRSEGESSRVCLTAPISGQFVTRALPSAAEGHRLRCILEVWNRDEIPALKYREEKTDLGGENVVFEFNLDEGTYDCLFWADFIASDAATDEASSGGVTYTHYADKYYTTNDAGNGLKAVSVIRSNYGAGFNSDVRDAFFGHYELTKGAAAVENPEIPALARPFAKLTVKERNAENYGSCNGLTATYSVPDTFNVLSGRVSDAVYEVTCSSKSSEEQTLFSDYIFSDSSSTLGSVSLTFTGAGKSFADVTVPGGIPLKRNYKTNAEGSLIAENEDAGERRVQLTVSVNAEWDSPDIDYGIGSVGFGEKIVGALIDSIVRVPVVANGVDGDITVSINVKEGTAEGATLSIDGHDYAGEAVAVTLEGGQSKEIDVVLKSITKQNVPVELEIVSLAGDGVTDADINEKTRSVALSVLKGLQDAWNGEYDWVMRYQDNKNLTFPAANPAYGGADTTANNGKVINVNVALEGDSIVLSVNWFVVAEVMHEGDVNMDFNGSDGTFTWRLGEKVGEANSQSWAYYVRSSGSSGDFGLTTPVVVTPDYETGNLLWNTGNPTGDINKLTPTNSDLRMGICHYTAEEPPATCGNESANSRYTAMCLMKK